MGESLDIAVSKTLSQALGCGLNTEAYIVAKAIPQGS